MTTYPVGTPVTAIKSFDRSTKVVFKCGLNDHSDSHTWMSKDPFVSTWFIAGYDGSGYDCLCVAAEMVTAEEYTSEP